MAFKKSSPQPQVPASPDQLLRMLSRRKIPDVLPHQSAMMRAYAGQALGESDVALQLPTGSGKTLVGLLIAEWRRRKFAERVVYLCPTNQLVNQVVDQANNKYGLSVLAFTGRVKNYAPKDRAAYRLGDHVAVTNYSSLFNTNPFFNDADVLILDDAHAAEGYVASNWSISIYRYIPEYTPIFLAVLAVVAPLLPERRVAELFANETTTDELEWVEKIPTLDIQSVLPELTATLDAQTASVDLKYPWSLLRDHLAACQVYLTRSEILIKPLIPPTYSCSAFTSPKQRIFMSATLGAGGDLERLLGRPNIHRLPISQGWDRQGVGRRFFIFPELSLNDDDAGKLGVDLIRTAGRAVLLVPSDASAKLAKTRVTEELGYDVFDAEDIENSKETFVQSQNAVAVIANRYDGIDFPGDDCRLLMVQGLPRAMNLQERFIMSQMGANILFNERVQTRVLQAIGRCTRSLEDYSAVVVSGTGLSDYLMNPNRRKYFHPELQAELQFGIEQSVNTNASNIVENLQIFLRDRQRWEDAEQEIIANAQTATQQAFPAMDELESVAPHEIRYQEAMWKGDFGEALSQTQMVLGLLLHKDLRGYRALWHYLAGSAAQLAIDQNFGLDVNIPRKHFTEAKKCAVAVEWLNRLSSAKVENAEDEPLESIEIAQLEAIENRFEKLGALHNAKYAKLEKIILDSLFASDTTAFEEGQRELGSLLGFKADNSSKSAAPDPWWYVLNLGIVFEDKSGADASTALSAERARQVKLHTAWINKNVPDATGVQFAPVLVAASDLYDEGADAFLEGVLYWELNSYKSWANSALMILSTIKTSFDAPGDIEWRIRAIRALRDGELTMPTIVARLQRTPAVSALKPKKKSP